MITLMMMITKQLKGRPRRNKANNISNIIEAKDIPINNKAGKI